MLMLPRRAMLVVTGGSVRLDWHDRWLASLEPSLTVLRVVVHAGQAHTRNQRGYVKATCLSPAVSLNVQRPVAWWHIVSRMIPVKVWRRLPRYAGPVLPRRTDR